MPTLLSTAEEVIAELKFAQEIVGAGVVPGSSKVNWMAALALMLEAMPVDTVY